MLCTSFCSFYYIIVFLIASHCRFLCDDTVSRKWTYIHSKNAIFLLFAPCNKSTQFSCFILFMWLTWSIAYFHLNECIKAAIWHWKCNLRIWWSTVHIIEIKSFISVEILKIFEFEESGQNGRRIIKKV